MTLVCLAPLEVDRHRVGIERDGPAVGLDRQKGLAIARSSIAFRNQALELAVACNAVVDEHRRHPNEQGNAA